MTTIGTEAELNAAIAEAMPEGSQPEAEHPTPAGTRLVAMDAFRGFWMLLMVSAGLRIHGMVEGLWNTPKWQHLKSPIWERLAHHTDHVEWVGCAFWDLIQPCFMFTVGCALAFSIASRRNKGQSFARMLGHALFRSVALVLLSVFLISYGRQTNWKFTNVLAQIGLGYTFLFLLAWVKPRWQFVAAVAILVVYWGAFAAYPKPPADLNLKSVNLPANWSRLEGFASHWEKNTNLATRADQWLLNQFPPYRTAKPEEKFRFDSGGYQTLNFVPSLATMLFGLLAGQLIRSRWSNGRKLLCMMAAGAAGVAIGWGLGRLGICPVVKRIWTPSWAIYSAGWAFLGLGVFFAVIEMARLKAWAFPLVVVGMNSILIYCMAQVMGPMVRENMTRHFGANVYEVFGEAYAPMAEAGFFLLFCWLVCWWMYRRRVFLRI